jgi:hypothetical protein
MSTKITKRTLALSSATLRTLAPRSLADVNGGAGCMDGAAGGQECLISNSCDCPQNTRK